MRSRKILSIMALATFAMHAHAQQLGLPVGIDAAPMDAGSLVASTAIVLSDDVNTYGGGALFNITESIAVSGDVGLIDFSGLNMGFALQGGGMYRLPDFPDVPIDFAVRGALGYATVSDDTDVDITSIAVMGLASYTIDDMFSVYGILGLAHARAKFSFGRFSVTETETEPAIGVGGLFTFMPEASVFAEIMHIDDTFFGFGGKFAF